MIAKSSAESKLYGVVQGAREDLGTRTLRVDRGDEVELRLELDATAAKDILVQTCLANVRGIDVKARACLPSAACHGRSADDEPHAHTHARTHTHTHTHTHTAAGQSGTHRY